MFGYIYITTNLINGKKYIGQRHGFNGDPYTDPYLGSGVLLQRAIKYYGSENFVKDIVQFCDNIDELNQAEIDWIAKYNAVESDEFYNIAKGGLAGDTWSGRSEESKNLFRTIIQQSNKTRIRDTSHITGEHNPAFGKKWCNDGTHNYLLEIEQIESNPSLSYGMIRTAEHNQKIAQAHKGKKHNYSSTNGKVCYNNGQHNKFLTQEQIEEYEKNGWVKGMINTRWSQCK